MSSAWEILGLEEGETDLRAIRSAYARKVREHRPDEDPAGFREVHEAYTALVAYCRREEAEQAAEPPPEEEPVPIEPPLADRVTRDQPAPGAPDAPASPDTRLAEREAAQPRAGPDPFPELRGAEGDGLVAALLEAGNRLRREPRLAPAWSRAVVEAATDHPRLLLRGVKPADLVLELDQGLGGVTGLIVDYCIETTNLGALAMLARAIAGSDVEPHDYGMAWVLVRLAASVALIEPDAAAKINDRIPATLELPLHDALEHRLLAARSLRSTSPEARHFVARIVLREEWNGTLPTAASRQALAVVARAAGRPDAPLTTLLEETVPAFLQAARSRRPATAVRRPQKKKQSVAPYLWALVVVISLAARNCDKTPEPDLSYRDIQKTLDDSRRYIDEYNRNHPDHPINIDPFPRRPTPQFPPPDEDESRKDGGG